MRICIFKSHNIFFRLYIDKLFFFLSAFFCIGASRCIFIGPYILAENGLIWGADMVHVIPFYLQP